MGFLLVDVFLGWGRLVFDSWWTFTLIWVPLIVVPDSSPRAYGGVGILLQRLHVGYALCRALAKSLSGTWLVFWVAFFRGVRASAPTGCSPRACGGVGILLQRLYVGYESSWSVLGFLVAGDSAGFWVSFSGGYARAHLAGVAPEALEG
jgi:hypothetical protein